MNKAYFGLVLVICLSACSPIKNYVSGQVEKTVSAIPTATPYPTATPNPTYTPIPLPTATPTNEPLTVENFDISELFVEADLPDDRRYDGGLLSTLPQLFDDSPEPEIYAQQKLKKMNDSCGDVTIAIYNDPEKLQYTFDDILDGMDGGATEGSDEGGVNPEFYHIAGVGEDAYISSAYIHFLGEYIIFADVNFKRCSAFVHIRFVDFSNSQIIIDYAKKLDERIQGSSACGVKD